MYLLPKPTTGRRKTSTARVFIKKGKGKIEINKRPIATYFPIEAYQQKVFLPLNLTKTSKKYDLKITVRGGGLNGQAEAVRLGVARALVLLDGEFKPVLKEHNLMTRDSRMVERKKPGKKKARKSFQFSKR